MILHVFIPLIPHDSLRLPVFPRSSMLKLMILCLAPQPFGSNRVGFRLRLALRMFVGVCFFSLLYLSNVPCVGLGV